MARKENGDSNEPARGGQDGQDAVKGRRRSAGLLAVSAMLVAAAPAEAQAPRNRGCFGKDVSTYARGGDAGFGQFMAGMAKSSDGVSEEVAYHKVGLVPDALAPTPATISSPARGHAPPTLGTLAAAT